MIKNKNLIFKLFSLLLSAMLIFSLGACKSEEEKPEEKEEYSKGMIKTYFDSEQLVYADYVIKGTEVDATGEKDSTKGIQKVLKRCADNGGGTVFLPRGKYRITSNISVPSFVYLKGDYNDPDKSGFNGDYGTMIIADVEKAAEVKKSEYLADKTDKYSNFPALITVGGSSGVDGLTVYYKNQNAEKVVPYPFTFEIPSFAGVGGSVNHMAPTIKNVTLINSYKGVCASVTPASDGKSAANEVLHLENIKGTALYQGLQLYNSSEVGVVRDITFSNEYWFNASAGYNGGDVDKMDAFTMKYGTGVLVGDLEWDTFTNIKIKGYKIGMRISDGLRRHIPGQPEIYFIGQIFNPVITECVTGLRVDNMFMNMGVNIAGGKIEGSLYSINDSYTGTSKIKLAGTELKGDTRGDSIFVSGGESEFKKLLAENKLPNTSAPNPKKVKLEATDATVKFKIDNTGEKSGDAAVKIQEALNAQKETGGGVVYLKPGYYRIKTAIEVPEGVELRGAASSNTRDQNGMSKGTVFLVEHGAAESIEKAKTLTATITLSGKNSGLSGIRFIYPNNAPMINNAISIKPYAYTVRAKASDAYVKYCSFVGVPLGIEFKGDEKISGCIVLGINGTFYYNGINIENVDNMTVEEALSNASVLARHNFRAIFPSEFASGWVSDGPQMTKIYDEVTRVNSKFITVSNSSVKIGNSFTFASFSVLTAKNSDITVYNTAGDNLSLKGNLFDISGGKLLGINIMRFQGAPLISSNNADCTILNRLSLHNNNDSDIVSGNEKAPAFVAGADSNENDLPEIYTYAL